MPAKLAAVPKHVVSALSTEFKITRVHQGHDLRTLRWRSDVLEAYVRRHHIDNNEAHVFINNARNKSRWIVVWNEVAFLIMAPIGHLLQHEEAMRVARELAANNKVYEILDGEITELE